jgi:hypothetical protein
MHRTGKDNKFRLGVDLAAFLQRLDFPSAVSPSFTGISTSIMMTSKENCGALSTASCPFSAVRTVWTFGDLLTSFSR